MEETIPNTLVWISKQKIIKSVPKYYISDKSGKNSPEKRRPIFCRKQSDMGWNAFLPNNGDCFGTKLWGIVFGFDISLTCTHNETFRLWMLSLSWRASMRGSSWFQTLRNGLRKDQPLIFNFGKDENKSMNKINNEILDICILY